MSKIVSPCYLKATRAIIIQGTTDTEKWCERWLKPVTKNQYSIISKAHPVPARHSSILHPIRRLYCLLPVIQPLKLYQDSKFAKSRFSSNRLMKQNHVKMSSCLLEYSSWQLTLRDASLFCPHHLPPPPKGVWWYVLCAKCTCLLCAFMYVYVRFCSHCYVKLK